MRRRRRQGPGYLAALIVSAAAVGCVGMPVALHGQEGVTTEAAAPDQFEERSLALRTALHYDPSLEAPLKALLKLYREAGRVDELLSIYRAHLMKYEDDASAQAVLIRLFRATSNAEAGEAARRAVERFPEEDYIRYLYYRELEARRDPAALEELSRALSMAKLPNRRRAWMEELMGNAMAEGKIELMRQHFEELAREEGDSAEGLLRLSRKMHEASLHDLALETLKAAAEKGASPETVVDIEVHAARAEAAQGRHEEAGERLDALLAKVAPDYWRRSQIVVERVHLLKTDAEREKMLKAARERFEANPKNEAMALDLAEVLVASELRRDALGVLLKASKELAFSEEIERKTLELLDRLGDERTAREYLKGRLEAFPERLDLRYRLVKALYLLGDAEEAEADFGALERELDAEDRLKQRLDLARFLRRMNQPADAVALYEKVVEAHPERIDVLRELGETYMAIGRRESARRLFVESFPKEAEMENFLDVVQFLLQQGMHLEAAAVVEERMEGEDGNFDLRVMLIEVYGKTGEQVKGEALILSTRELADTQARYNRWLEEASEFFETFDAGDSFFEAEQERLASGEGKWTPESMARFLSFCEIAGRHQQQAGVIGLLRDRLFDERVPEELRPRLRRLLVEALEADPASAGEVQEHLAVLVAEDEERADEYRLRQARIYKAAGRPDLALPLLGGLDIAKIEDVGLLSGSYQMFLDLNKVMEGRQILERLTQVEGETLGHWDKLLGVLASFGEEDELRRTIRRLLVGLGKVQLTSESVASLRLHVLDSYWRTIARLLARAEESEHAQVFNHLNAIEREGAGAEDEMWVLWTRAYLLNLRGQAKARDEALEILENVARDFRAKKAQEKGDVAAAGDAEEREDGRGRIDFPDGLSVSLEHALELLREPPRVDDAVVVEAGEGPSGPVELKWLFESDPTTAIVQVEKSAGEGLLVLDDQGNLYRLDGVTGKLLWRKRRAEIFGQSYRPPNMLTRRSLAPYRGHGGARYGSPHGRHQVSGAQEPSRLRIAPRLAVSEGGRILVPTGNALRCFRGEDGALLWVSEVGGEVPPFHLAAAGSVPPGMSLFLEGDRAYTFDPGSGVACGVEVGTGKLIWRRAVYGEGMYPVLFGLNAGASYSGGNLLIYGRESAVIDCMTGAVTWGFDGGEVRTFPLTLQAESEGGYDGLEVSPMAGMMISTIGSGSRGAHPVYRSTPTMWMNHLAGRERRRGEMLSFLKYKGALVAPALYWVNGQTQRGRPAKGVLKGRRMLLMGGGGIDVLSLNLPLAAVSHRVEGTFAGFAGSVACFVRGNRLQLMHLGRGTVETIVIDELASNAEVDVVVSGPRVYVTSEEGIHCFNAYTAKILFKADWTERVRERVKGGGDGVVTGEKEPVYYWSGVAGGAKGKAGYCIPPRGKVRGEKIFTLIDSRTLAALETAP